MKKAPRIPRSAPRRAAPRQQRHGGREWYFVALGLLVAFAIAIPVAVVLDRRADRTKPMYQDVVAMESLQYQLVKNGKAPRPLVVKHGHEVQLVGTRFSPHPGVTIEVTVKGDDYCVRGTNRFGDVSDWKCDDGSTNPDPYGAATADSGTKS